MLADINCIVPGTNVASASEPEQNIEKVRRLAKEHNAMAAFGHGCERF